MATLTAIPNDRTANRTSEVLYRRATLDAGGQADVFFDLPKGCLITRAKVRVVTGATGTTSTGVLRVVKSGPTNKDLATGIDLKSAASTVWNGTTNDPGLTDKSKTDSDGVGTQVQLVSTNTSISAGATVELEIDIVRVDFTP